MKFFIIGFILKWLIVDIPREWKIRQENKAIKKRNRAMRRWAKRNADQFKPGGRLYNAGLDIKNKFP